MAYWVRTRLEKTSNEQPDYTRLRAHLLDKPRTKAGQVRQAWPEIKNLIAVGHSLKDICAWLNEIGLEIGYARLSHYIGQMRERDASQAPVNEAPPRILAVRD
jgi:hypothetical protein